MNESISLAFNDLAAGGSSDKVYHMSLENLNPAAGWKLTIQYGRRGAALMSQVKCQGCDYPKAKKMFDKILREKLAKGYQMEGAPIAPPVAPSGKKVDVKHPELLDEITNGHGADPFIVDSAYWMQDKSDGVSRGVVKQDGEIFGINKRGLPVPLPAELVEELSKINLTTFQLDAELVGNRLICRDLLVANFDMSQLPYYSRFALLDATITGLKLVSLVETWTGADKAPAMKASKEARREGVVFKLTSAPYRAGRSGQHKKYKFIKTLSAMAGEPRAGGKESVDLFLWDSSGDKQWVRCGTVSLIGKPAIRKGDIVEVAYLYAMPSGLMVQARLLSVRQDVTAAECTTTQLIFKSDDA